jgi:hypothetical protein
MKQGADPASTLPGPSIDVSVTRINTSSTGRWMAGELSPQVPAAAVNDETFGRSPTMRLSHRCCAAVNAAIWAAVGVERNWNSMAKGDRPVSVKLVVSDVFTTDAVTCCAPAAIGTNPVDARPSAPVEALMVPRVPPVAANVTATLATGLPLPSFT